MKGGEGAYADWGLEPFGSVKLAIAHSFSPRIVGSARMVSCHSDTQVWQWAKERAASTEQPSSTVWIHPYRNRKALDAFVGVTSTNWDDLRTKETQCAFLKQVLSTQVTCVAVLGVHMLGYVGSSILAAFLATWDAELGSASHSTDSPTLYFVGVLPALCKTSWQITLPATDLLWSRIPDFKECWCMPCAPNDLVYDLLNVHQSGKIDSLLQSGLVDSEIGTLTDLHELAVRGKPRVLCLPPCSKAWALKSLSEKIRAASTDLEEVCGPSASKIVLLVNSSIAALDVTNTVGRLSMDPANPVKIIERVPGLIYDQDPAQARQRDAAYAENLAYIV